VCRMYQAYIVYRMYQAHKMCGMFKMR